MNKAIEVPECARHPGDPADPERWVDDHHARLYAYLRRRTGSEAEAVELTQQTFTRAWGSKDRFENRSSVSSWLHGIAHHVWLDWRRKGKRFEDRSEAWWEQVPCGGIRPDESVERSDTSGSVFAAVECLEDDLRDTVHLHYYQGLSLSETADALGIAASTVKYRLRESLTRLQRTLSSPSPLASKPTSFPTQ